MSDAHNQRRRTAKDVSPERWLELSRCLALLPLIDVVVVGQDTFLTAQSGVTGCESCASNASIPFSSVLDEITHRYDRVTNYLLFEPAKCRNCDAPIVDTTLVVFESKFDRNPGGLDYFDAPIENVVFIDEDILIQAEQWITACEHCSENAEVLFDQILDSLTGCNPTITDYVICRQAKCPCCNHAVTEKTLVIPS